MFFNKKINLDQAENNAIYVMFLIFALFSDHLKYYKFNSLYEKTHDIIPLLSNESMNPNALCI